MPSNGGSRQSRESVERERVRILAKLFSFYPEGGGDERAELRFNACCDELSDIPPYWLGWACRLLIREPGRRFCPTVNEIREKAAWCIRRARRASLGQPPDFPWDPHIGTLPVKPELEFAWLRQQSRGATEVRMPPMLPATASDRERQMYRPGPEAAGLPPTTTPALTNGLSGTPRTRDAASARVTDED